MGEKFRSAEEETKKNAEKLVLMESKITNTITDEMAKLTKSLENRDDKACRGRREEKQERDDWREAATIKIDGLTKSIEDLTKKIEEICEAVKETRQECETVPAKESCSESPTPGLGALDEGDIVNGDPAAEPERRDVQPDNAQGVEQVGQNDESSQGNKRKKKKKQEIDQRTKEILKLDQARLEPMLVKLNIKSKQPVDLNNFNSIKQTSISLGQMAGMERGTILGSMNRTLWKTGFESLVDQLSEAKVIKTNKKQRDDPTFPTNIGPILTRIAETLVKKQMSNVKGMNRPTVSLPGSKNPSPAPGPSYSKEYPPVRSYTASVPAPTTFNNPPPPPFRSQSHPPTPTTRLPYQPPPTTAHPTAPNHRPYQPPNAPSPSPAFMPPPPPQQTQPTFQNPALLNQPHLTPIVNPIPNHPLPNTHFMPIQTPYPSAFQPYNPQPNQTSHTQPQPNQTQPNQYNQQPVQLYNPQPVLPNPTNQFLQPVISQPNQTNQFLSLPTTQTPNQYQYQTPNTPLINHMGFFQ